MRNIFTEPEEQAICERYKSGENMREIADTVFCDPLTVHNILKRHNVPTRSNHRTPEQRKAIIDLFVKYSDNTRPYKIVSLKTGLTTQQIRDVIAHERRSGRL